VGTSVGSLNGAMVAPAGGPPIDRRTDTRKPGHASVANFPMRQAVAMGAKSLVVLDCAFPGTAA